jgi:hypothetical protein
MTQIYSIDDTSFRIWWKEKNYDDMKKIQIKLAAIITNTEIINGDEFLKECLKIGSDEESIDYN